MGPLVAYGDKKNKQIYINKIATRPYNNRANQTKTNLKSKYS